VIRIPFRRSLILLCAISFFCPALSFGKIVDRIVAVVNNEVITQSELDRVLYPIYMQYRELYKTDEVLYEMLNETRQDVLKQLIGDRLILGEAKKMGLSVSEKEIDREVTKIRQDLEERDMSFSFLLREQNISISDLREKYKDQLLIQKAVDERIKTRVRVQPSEVRDYYRDNLDDYTHPAKARVGAILIKLESVRSPAQSRRLAEDVRRMLLSGKDFKGTARNYSEGPNSGDGGNMGYVERGRFLKEIDDEIFYLAPGAISKVIETPVGFHIFKLYDRRDAQVLPFDEVRGKVTETLYRLEAKRRLDEWLDDLKSNAYIDIK